jgi:hypothetical protein
MKKSDQNRLRRDLYVSKGQKVFKVDYHWTKEIKETNERIVKREGMNAILDLVGKQQVFQADKMKEGGYKVSWAC